MTENYLIERAKRGDRTKYEAILAKIPDVEPEAYDRLPNVQLIVIINSYTAYSLTTIPVPC
jgi:hypothetical protein